MKKLFVFFILLLVLMGFILSGCNGGNDDMSYKETRELCDAIHDENIDVLFELLENVNDVNKTTYPPSLSKLFLLVNTSPITTPLIEAVKSGNILIINTLLEKGADPNFSEKCGSTAIEQLYNAKHPNNLEIAKALIAYGADVNNTKDSIWYPIFSLVLYSKLYDKSVIVSNMKLLLENGALLIDKTGYSILRYMINCDVLEEEYLNCIIANSEFDLNFVEPDGKTNLIYLVEKEMIEPIKILLSKGIDKTIKNNDGKTALDIAEEKGNIEIINLLEN